MQVGEDGSFPAISREGFCCNKRFKLQGGVHAESTLKHVNVKLRAVNLNQFKHPDPRLQTR